MNIMLLLAHPSGESFNHAIAAKIREAVIAGGHNLGYHDLYAEGFDPLITAEELAEDYTPGGLLGAHCEELREADSIIVVHPNYRNQPPAILKGWVDRVIRAGVAFRYEGEEGDEGSLVGMLKARSALIVNTADCPEEADRETGFPLKQFWDRDVFSGCGVGRTVYTSFYGVLFSSAEQRAGWLESLPALVDAL